MWFLFAIILLDTFLRDKRKDWIPRMVLVKKYSPVTYSGINSSVNFLARGSATTLVCKAPANLSFISLIHQCTTGVLLEMPLNV